MKNKTDTQIGLVAYTRKQDILNCVSHSAGVVFSLFAIAVSLRKTVNLSFRYTLSAVIYCFSMLAVYLCSSVYHGLKPSKAKIKARKLDHIAIPLLLAGTAAPCALITLYRLNKICCAVCLSLSWFCALFGIFAKTFYFEKLKTACMVVYFTGGLIMLLCAVPVLKELNLKAFGFLLSGCVFYILGGIFCAFGRKHPWLHLPFHLLTLSGTVTHFYAIYTFVL